MSESHLDEYEHFNYDQDKYVHSSHSGKNRSKKEAEERTNRNQSGGHTRKIVTKLKNTEVRKKSNSTSSNGSTGKNDQSTKDDES